MHIPRIFFAYTVAELRTLVLPDREWKVPGGGGGEGGGGDGGGEGGPEGGGVGGGQGLGGGGGLGVGLGGGVAGGGSANAHDCSNALLYVAAVGSCRARALGLEDASPARPNLPLRCVMCARG